MTDAPVLQGRIPYDVLSPLPLPSLRPFDMADWLDVDEAYEAQMAERRRLIAETPEAVCAVTDDAAGPALELLALLRDVLRGRPDFDVGDADVICPDGYRAPMDLDKPLITLGRILQEDFCIVAKSDDAEEHHLAGAILCFPASWRLSEKIGRPLTAVHAPVPEYAPQADKVQKLFDAVRVGRPFTRNNVLFYDDPALFQPRSETAPRPLNDPESAPFIRSERQCMVRLPQTGAVVFSIHTYVVRAETILGKAGSKSA